MTTFHDLGLSGETLKGVLAAGYQSPTPIQTAAIPIAASGKDLIGCAQTGTGKTAAFVLPMLQRLSDSPRPKRGRPVRALVVTPTRELALQVETAIRKYRSGQRLWSTSMYGGVAIQPQIRQLRKGVEIVVATPGRLLDHVNRGTLDLSRIEILVLDEADRMLDMGFIHDIRKIVAETPDDRQTLLFSATMPKEIQRLTESIQRTPEFIQIGEQRNPAETVNQRVCKVSPRAKMDLLYHVLRNESIDSVLVFSRTKYRADRIAHRLDREGFAATVMHSNRSQNQRQHSLDGFRRGKYQIMVATDIAARGIDVESISHVINYDTPNQAEDYIHRIGRTGRAETSGEAITFVAADEENYLRAIERHTGQKLGSRQYEGFHGARQKHSENRSSNGQHRNGRTDHTRSSEQPKQNRKKISTEQPKHEQKSAGTKPWNSWNSESNGERPRRRRSQRRHHAKNRFGAQ